MAYVFAQQVVHVGFFGACGSGRHLGLCRFVLFLFPFSFFSFFFLFLFFALLRFFL
jgi:hypothetical protein